MCRLEIVWKQLLIHLWVNNMNINSFLNIPDIISKKEYLSVECVDLINNIDYSHESASYLLNAYSVALGMFFFESSYYDMFNQDFVLPTNNDVYSVIAYILSDAQKFDLKELPYMHFLSLDNRNIRYVIEDTGVVVGYFAFVSSLILYVIDNLILAIRLNLSENDIVMMSACLSNLLNKLYLGIDVFHNIPAVCLRNLLYLLVNIHDEAVLDKVAKESKRKLAGSGGAKKAHNIKAKRKTVYEYIDITEKDLNGSIAYKARVLANRIRKKQELFVLVNDINILENWIYDYLKKKKCLQNN